ncbi:nuclear pore complex protein NUP205 [Gossypium arboreum]|uniref:nuclear pore complex protein NUP205 n=1 Tax=Gossypium arboreum TaxID=29729 RepID=UPI000818F46E|nr:nuclear pore complex protein NUP205 [Gossypium arboreum]XP_017648952.1 nuclear pore complex protein NUP205 [Gossypium arboreum]
MVTPKQLLSIIESSVVSPFPPSPAQRIELLHAIRTLLPSFKSLLSYPPPRPSDRAQVRSKEVRLPNSPPISLDDQDVQIALKLSDELYLNEIDCVQLLVSANQEWGLVGRGPLEILRLAAGLWYSERRDIMMSLYTLLSAAVIDPGLEAGLVADIQKYLEDLINAGLRQRLISLIKELNREEPAGLGGPLSEHYLLDSRGALVERRAVVYRERLLLGHCLVLSVLVVRTGPKDVKDVFSVLKDSAAELSESSDTIKHQITHSLLFFLVIAFVSDALSALSDKSSILSDDASFRKEFQDTVMAVVNDPNSEGFVGGVRLAWVVHLMLIHDEIGLGEAVSTVSSNEFGYINFCLESVFAKNVFHFLLEKVLRSAAYQNDDEDMVYMYNAYLHKLITCFLSHPVARDKVKESKEKAMITLNTYRMAGDFVHDGSMQGEQAAEGVPLPFVSLLEFVSEIYQKEPELLSGNDVLWTFVNFAGEDHTNFQTLVAFLNMLSTLASSQEGASKVYELLQGKAFRSIGWSTLFNCLSIYDEKYKQSLQTAGAMLPEFQEGDAKALVAYLNVLQKVVQNGNPIERKNWFPDIEPLFKLLSYENVPTYLKGALRNTIATFVRVSPVLKDTIWTFLEQYDLPVVVGSQVGISGQPMAAQVYDMQFELNEIEARREQYPSTISFLNLLNALIAEEKDVSDRGRRFFGIFRFIYDHVFGPFPQRAYADPSEKWQLVVACLQHFHMILSMYDIQEQDIDSVIDRSQLSAVTQPSSLQMQLPILELLKDFMSGKTVFRNIMSILMPGVNTIIAERNSQVYGPLLEKAVQLSLEIVILVLEKDILLADFWRPLYQPLDVVLSQDYNQIVALLEYVRYDFLPQIQQSSIKIMSILSSRMVGLVQLLLKSNVATSLIEDYASCLEFRSQECQVIENGRDDPGILIMQLLIDNVSRPAPNITHLLLKFDLDTSIEQTLLQPKFHFSCLKVILEILENLSKPDVNASIHEFGFQLLYELCLDPLTCGPTLDLLSNKKYHFFVKHLDSVGVAPLPKRNSNQALRISSLHQRAWLLKLLAVELHAAYMSSPHHREACQSILAHLFGLDFVETGTDVISQSLILQNNKEHTATRTISKTKVSELLEVVQFRSPDTTMNLSQIISNMKYNLLVEDILRNPSTSGKGGIYYYSERGDRLIDLASLRDKLWQKFNSVYPQLSNFGNEADLNEVRETIQQLLRWGWRYNKNLEEQAAQLHMLTGWSHIVEVSVSRRILSLENRSEILYQILDACLGASASPDCLLKMAFILSQVALTCMAKLRDDRFLFPGGFSSDNITCLDIIMVKQLSNGACHSLLFKLIMAILRNESSEALRRRQYALLLSYFQYCQHMLVPNVPTSVLQQLLLDEQDGEELDLQKIDKEQAELARANFSILRKEAQAILDLVIKDATHGSEPGKTISLYVLDAVVCIDHERYFLSQLQSRGFLRSCLMSISSFSSADGGHSLDSMQRACTLEAELALLLRICHKYGKSGAQVLFSMGALEHLASCRAVNLQGSLRVETKLRRDGAVDVDKQRMIVTPVLRLVFSLTSLIDTSEFFEVKNKIVREVIDFVKGHHLVFDHVLREDVSGADDLLMEQINLVVGILSKVWPYEESGEYGFVQGLFSMMHILFSCDSDRPFLSISTRSPENRRKSELNVFQLCFSLSSYLYFLVTKKSLRLQVSDDSPEYHSPVSLQQPTLNLLCSLLNGVINSLERAAEEKSLLLNKIRDINELSRQEVDEVINMCVRQDLVSASDDIQKRRYIAMVEMCQVAGNRDQLISLLLPLVEHILNVIIIHFQDSSGVFNTNGSMKTITYGSKPDSGQEISLLCGKLIPLLERLELLSEEKVGHNLKVFRRSVASLKEMAIQKFAG